MKSGTIIRLTSRAMLLVAGMTLAACQAIYANHGYVPTDRELREVKVGQTTREELGPLIGPPSSSGVLEGSGWYYVQSRWRHYGAFAPKEVERQVVAISFAPNGSVSNIERFGLEDGNVVTLSRRTTDTNIKGVGIVQQLLGNVGRMNAGQFIDTPSTNN